MSSQNTTQVSLPFTVVDVFTETPYAGNPLAVVRLPTPESFSPRQDQLQNIAREFNLSETIFLEERTEQDIEKQRCRARIFTVQREILFAGHPTVGAATWLLYHSTSTTSNEPDGVNTSIKTLIPGAGPIPINVHPSKPGYISAIAPHTYHEHAQRFSTDQLFAIHQTLSPHIPQKGATFPIVSIVKGMTWALVELPSLEALAAAQLPNSSANVPADSGILDQGWEYNSTIGVYLFVRNAEPEQGDGVETVRTRMLIRGIEDPATGSAASALTGYLAQREAKEVGRERKWKIVQGVEMGRRSEIGVEVKLGNAGSGAGSGMQITLSGTAVVVTEGRINVPA